ncbi:MAG: flagellar protein FliT [Bdellovibrionales bacterium]|nr:flagellar protein FliT [Bdellovibrionales bacterium]
MQRTLVLLKERNHYFGKFKTINESELIRLSGGDFSNIDVFYKTRENILNMVAHLEDMIEKRLNSNETEDDVTVEMKSILVETLKEKDRLIKTILAQDLEILDYIEKEKNKIIIDLKTLTTGRKALSAYQHSTPLHRLDEEL